MYGSSHDRNVWNSQPHMRVGSRTPLLTSSNCSSCGVTFSCWICKNSTSCRRCGQSFCKRCCGRTARLKLWGYSNTQVKVCQNCHRMATEENDFVERWYPLLLRGERYKKHGTILVSNVRVQLHPSCRRLEYWKPPHLTRVQANEVKGIDVGSLLGVCDVQGLRIRVTGLDRGSEKTMNLETLDYKTKKEWMIALKALYSMRTIIASPEFSRVAHGNVTSQHNINEGRETNKYEYQQEKQQQQPPQRQLLPAVSVEQQERRTKWQERREARAAKMDRISKKYAKR